MGRLQGAGVVARGTEEKTVSCQVRCRFAAVVSLKRSTCELSLTWFEKGTWAPGRKYVLGGDLYWLGLAWSGRLCFYQSVGQRRVLYPWSEEWVSGSSPCVCFCGLMRKTCS